MAFARINGDELEDWERDLTRADGYPVIATAICLLTIFALAVTQALSERSFTLGVGLLAATGGSLALWIIAYFITIRHSTLRWKLGSLAIIWTFAILTSIWAVRSANAALNYDLTMLDEIEWNAGEATLPEHPDRGLLSRAAIKLVGSLNDERKTQTELLEKLQIQAIGNAGALERKPDLLTDCDRFSRAKPAVATSMKRAVTSVVRFRTEVEASSIQPNFKKSFIADLDRKFTRFTGNPSTLLNLINEQLDLTKSACTILARHHWQGRKHSVMVNGRQIELGGSEMIAFSSAGDLKAYDLIARRSRQLREQGLAFFAKN